MMVTEAVKIIVLFLGFGAVVYTIFKALDNLDNDTIEKITGESGQLFNSNFKDEEDDFFLDPEDEDKDYWNIAHGLSLDNYFPSFPDEDKKY